MSEVNIQTSHPLRIVIIGGGAAGFFAAIACAEAAPGAEVTLLEKTAHFLAKVRISGGGRCNVTHACFEPRPLSQRYPRGDRALIAPFHRFQPQDTIAWFAERGVRLKTEADGRMFPITDSSETIIDCLLQAARQAGVQLLAKHGVDRARRLDGGGFELDLSTGATLQCDRLLLAIGGCRSAAAGALAEMLGHRLEPPVPSLFAFHSAAPLLEGLAGLSMETVEASIPETGLRERGPLLITHTGVSGPAILRLSAWGARVLHDCSYLFPLYVNWLPAFDGESIKAELRARREANPAKLVANTPLHPVPSRLWERLLHVSGIGTETRWSNLSRDGAQALAAALTRSILPIDGKSLNKDEFVTCGGVSLREVDLKTMESRICPGLYFAGEVLDIDGITGGFNFQAAWTTGWIAAQAMASQAVD